MIYVTGDIHGYPWRIWNFAQRLHLGADDVIVLLGDVGANFHGGKPDRDVKIVLDMLGVKLLCIHGNHEMRPARVPGYELTEWRGGKVWAEEEFPNLLFAKDGEIFELGSRRCIAIGGAYSIDKAFRTPGRSWWEDEQPSDEIKAFVEKQLAAQKPDTVFSHTCPFRYEPREAFLEGFEQSGVDTSTERWLGTLEEKIDYRAWYCGHWHIDKRVDRMHFLFERFEKLETGPEEAQA